jgi:hypothetical protein
MQESSGQISPRLVAGWRRLSAVELLIALAVLLISFPFVQPLHSGVFIESILFSFVLISSVLAIAESRRTVVIAGILAVPALVGRWVSQYGHKLLPLEISLAACILLTAYVVWNLLRFLFRARSVDTETLCIGLSAYLLLGLLWAFAYWLVDELVPNAFFFGTTSGADATIQGLNGLYYSFITLCTVGYGDIVPVAGIARMLAAIEAIVGMLYVAVLIARLVALHATPTSLSNEN